MSKKSWKGWIKHADFILLDIISLQLSFIIAYWITRSLDNPYSKPAFRFQALVLFVSQAIVILFFNNYSGILRRKRFDELSAVLRYIITIQLVSLTYLFIVHRSGTVSRLQVGFTSVLFVFLGYVFRQLNKKRIAHFVASRNQKSLVLVTSTEYVKDALEKLYDPDAFQDFFVSRIILMDGADDLETSLSYGERQIPIISLSKEAISVLQHEWVDEVFVLQPENIPFQSDFMDELRLMGITVDYTQAAMIDDRFPMIDLRKLGGYKVITNSVNFAAPGQAMLKRGMDILGGIIGCIITGILYIFIAPAIQREDPGPVFFRQDRVGKNGKIFKIHKFRTMYTDAEQRKAELEKQNYYQNGKMFKLENDPRIIGSQKKHKNGKPAGLGNFLRSSSLDEFPQFFDILIGNMSLVGWRPCTVDEWNAYDLQHRIRASMKPGLTGAWQVSGRSDITDFDEVVRLDREYIENWSLGLDIKILLKTVVVVLSRKGAR